jgi:hypothetical protein
MANPRPKQADPYGQSESAQDPELPCARFGIHGPIEFRLIQMIAA